MCDIFTVPISRFRLAKGLDLGSVAKRCPFNYTGADLYALCSDGMYDRNSLTFFLAMLNAMLRLAHSTDQEIKDLNDQGDMYQDTAHVYPITPEYYAKHIATPEQMLVQVEMSDFEQALSVLVPSVSLKDLERYESQRRVFEVAR